MKIGERRRKRLRISTSYSSMNQDVLVEILSRLPVKSLIRFRCVSQEWNALTRNAHFVARHLSFSDPNRYLFLDRKIITGNDGNETELYGLSLLQDDGVKVKFTSLHLPFFNHKSWVAANYMGSSNGLVCLRLEDENCNTNEREFKDFIVVCNPATRDFRYLPTPTPFRMKGDRPLLGFEFMHDIREYKLANIFPYVSDNGSEVGLTFQAQVFTQSSNSWRQVTYKLEFPSSKRDCHSFSSITFNGVMYWTAKDGKSNDYYALSFDIYDEVFNVLPLPMLRLPENVHLKYRPSFHIWKNSLATLLPSLPTGYYQELWVMAKSETPSIFSWTRQFRMRTSSIPSGYFMGFLKDQLLLNYAAWKEIKVLYDPATKETRYIPTHRSTKKYLQFQNYVQSLLPVR